MDYLTVIKIMMVFVLVGISTYTDIKSRKIPNKLTVPFVLAGVLVNTVFNFPEGLKISLLGFLVGFVVFLVPYMMGAMGAGDIKLMAAIGAITNPFAMAYITILTTLVGGVIVIGVRLKRREMLYTLKRMGRLILFYIFSGIYMVFKHAKLYQLKEANRLDMTDDQIDFIPYGAAIAGGAVITIGLSVFGMVPGLYI